MLFTFHLHLYFLIHQTKTKSRESDIEHVFHIQIAISFDQRRVVARVLSVTRRDVRTGPITLRNRVRACVWKCLCCPGYTYLGSTIHPSYMLFCTRYASTRPILETATLLFLRKIESFQCDPKTTRWNRSEKQPITNKICDK